MNNELKEIIDREISILNTMMDSVKYTGQWKGRIEKIIQRRGYTPLRMQDLGYMYLEGRGVPTNVKKGIELMEEGLRFLENEENEKGDY